MTLPPAYDLLPTNSGQGFQKLACGKHGKDSNLVNAISESDAFGLSKEEADYGIIRVIEVVNTWQTHFAKVGVCKEDIDSLALRIDGEHLLDQRSSFDIATYQI